MNCKIIVDNIREAEFINHIVHTGLLNLSKERVEEDFSEFADAKLGITFIPEDTCNTIYGAKEIESGKLVSDITNPKKKYWDKKGSAKKAVEEYNLKYANRKLPYSVNRGEHSNLEMIEFILIENKEAE